jgi:hypothetical protein
VESKERFPHPHSRRDDGFDPTSKQNWETPVIDPALKYYDAA